MIDTWQWGPFNGSTIHTDEFRSYAAGIDVGPIQLGVSISWHRDGVSISWHRDNE